MQVKAIVFDLDGTLLNTLTDLHASVNYTLARFGLLKRSEREVRSYLGNGVVALMRCALPDDKKDLLDECMPVFRAYYDVHNADMTAPYDGVIAMLEQVKALGIKSAIVSNKYDAAVQKLKNETFTGLIDFALGEGGGIAPKPAPDGVRIALEKLGESEENAIYVGDSEVDLATAANASLKCVACSWGFRDKSELLSRGAKNVIDAPSELIPLLKSGEIY